MYSIPNSAGLTLLVYNNTYEYNKSENTRLSKNSDIMFFSIYRSTVACNPILGTHLKSQKPTKLVTLDF
jgi:hypothetical protein